MINNVGGHAHMRVHAQRMETCMQLGPCDTPQFLSQMKSDFYETWYEHEVCIKDETKKNWKGYAHVCKRNVHKCACTFLYFASDFKHCINLG